jgi:hypothetical protein
VTEPGTQSSAPDGRTAKRERRLGWLTIALGIVVLIVTILFAVIGGQWWAIAIGATTAYLFYTGFKALQRAKQLSE